jgi:hypothetical protein
MTRIADLLEQLHHVAAMPFEGASAPISAIYNSPDLFALEAEHMFRRTNSSSATVSGYSICLASRSW